MPRFFYDNSLIFLILKIPQLGDLNFLKWN